MANGSSSTMKIIGIVLLLVGAALHVVALSLGTLLRRPSVPGADGRTA